VQTVDPLHDTPFKVLDVNPDGFGVLCTVQLEPLHRSASVTVSVPLL
jgi:hypothetical protein